MEKEIKLQSRGNLNNKLVHIEGNKYQLETQFSYRTGYKDDPEGEVTFIDPSGGPFMTVGTEIEGRKIKALHKGAIVEFEDE